MRSRPMRALAIAATLMFVAAACGGGTPAPTTGGSTGPGPTTAVTEQLHLHRALGAALRGEMEKALRAQIAALQARRDT